MPSDEHTEESHRYGRGAVLWREKNASYYRVAERYEDVDTGQLLYRVWDATHTHDYHYYEEDLLAEFEPAGICVDTKPAAVFGGRIGGKLVGWRNIWGKEAEHVA